MYNPNPQPFTMKRSHSPDPDEGGGFNFRNNNRRPNFHKRQHIEQKPETIETKIARVGEYQTRNSNTYISKIFTEITRTLLDKAREDETIKSITSKICQCIVSFPTRVPSYATLIGLISTKNYNVSSQIINTLLESYPVYLEAQKWQEAMTIFHTIAYLVNCKVIQPNALLEQFDALIEAAQEEGIPQVRSDYFVYTILSSLPYVALELSTQGEQLNNFEKILSTIETYLDNRSRAHLPNIQVWKTENSTSQMDYLDSLWVQIKNFRANGWIEGYLIRPHQEKEISDHLTTNLITHQSTKFQIPAHSDNNIYPNPRVVLRFFEDDATDMDIPIPGSDKIERFCIENIIRHLIDELDGHNGDLARRLKGMSHNEDKFSIKHVVIETLLGEMFTIPRPKYDEFLYQTLIYDVSKCYDVRTKPEELKFNFGYMIHQAVQILYDNIDTMNVSCIDRFVKWFSLYLNDTSFVYPWQTWSGIVNKDPDSPQTLFVKSILHHCIRFSFHKMVETIVSKHLPDMLPPEPKVTFQPSIEAGNNETLAETYKRMITTKQDPPEVCRILNIKMDGVQLPDDFELLEEKPFEKLSKIDIFFATLLNLGARSISHLSSGIGKYKSAIKALIEDIEGGQIQLLKTAHSCLQNHPQLLIILVEKLFKAELVNEPNICEWIFSELKEDGLPKIHLYEILFNTYRRISVKFHILGAEARSQAKASLAEKAKDTDDADDIEMKMEQTDEPVVDQTNNEFERSLQAAKVDFINQLLGVMSRFADLLLEHSRNNQSIGREIMDNSFRLKIGKMQQFYFAYYELLSLKQKDISACFEQLPNCLAWLPVLNV